MKLYAYITRPEDFIEGDRNCLTLRTTNDSEPGGWIFVQEVDIDFDSSDVNENRLRTEAVLNIDAEIDMAKRIYVADLQTLQERKERLMAITHQPQAGDDQ